MTSRNTPRMMHLLYPERRRIAAAEVMSWASDVFANEAPAYRCHGCGVTYSVMHFDKPLRPELPTTCQCDQQDTDTTPVYPDEPEAHAPVTLEEACELLEDKGVATFKRWRTA